MQAKWDLFAGHGGRIDGAAAAFPDAPRPWLDLSTGINPNPWTPPAPIAVDPGPLPARSDLARLEATAAAFFGTTPDRVAAVPGSEIALRLLPALGLPAPIVAIAPAYPTHHAVADHTIALGLAPEGTLLLANPNNPDGRLLTAPQLLALVRDGSWANPKPRPFRGGVGVGPVNPDPASIPPAPPPSQKGEPTTLVIDEAFADAHPDSSLIPQLTEDAPVIVLRSFGKFFGLAGLRLGFVIAPPSIIARLRALLGDWPVSAHALAYGQAAYADTEWIAATREVLPRRAAALDALLARHGLAATGACPLFRLIETPDAPALFERLARAGILVRPFAAQPTWLRFGLPADDAAMARLDRALAHG